MVDSRNRGVKYASRDRIVLHETAHRITQSRITSLNAPGHNRYILQEPVKCVTMVSVDSLEPVKRCGNGAMRLGVAAGARDGHVVIHELYLIGAVVSAVVGELDFKSPYGFEVDFKCHLARARPYSRRCLSVVTQQPSALLCLIHIIFVDKTESEVQSGAMGP